MRPDCNAGLLKSSAATENRFQGLGHPGVEVGGDCEALGFGVSTMPNAGDFGFFNSGA